MLTFESRRKGNQIDSRDGIYLYHNGTSTRLPGLNMCESPAFMPGGQRLALSCGRRYDSPPRQYTPEQLQNDPALAAVSSVNLDGSDWRTLVPYAPVIRSDHPCCGYGVSRIEFSPADGAMLLNIVAGSDGHQMIVLGDSSGNVRPPLQLGDGTYRRADAAFAPGGLDLLLWRCRGCYVGQSDSPPSSDLVQTDRSGRNERVVLSFPPYNAPGHTSASSDGQSVVFAIKGQIYAVSLPGGLSQSLASGSNPAWQPQPATPQSGEQYFPETGQTVRGRFLDYWQTHGGLAINGFPISDEFNERLEDGKEYRVQYFERTRLEYHPENPYPYDVLLGQFGRRILANVPNAPTMAVPPRNGYTYFAETGHNVSPRFMDYWQSNGRVPDQRGVRRRPAGRWPLPGAVLRARPIRVSPRERAAVRCAARPVRGADP
jgi:hypothetical protein